MTKIEIEMRSDESILVRWGSRLFVSPSDRPRRRWYEDSSRGAQRVSESRRQRLERLCRQPEAESLVRRFPRLIRRFPRLKTTADKPLKGNSMNAIEKNKATYYVGRCKRTGNFWYESLEDFFCMEELDHHSFEDSPLGAVRVGQDPGDFEEELEVIKKYLPKGEFDASDFELVKVDVSYTLSRP